VRQRMQQRRHQPSDTGPAADAAEEVDR